MEHTGSGEYDCICGISFNIDSDPRWTVPDEIRKTAKWITQKDEEMLVTDMDDRHLINSIRMFERSKQEDTYGHIILCAERAVRGIKNSPSKPAKKTGNQMEFSLESPEPPKPKVHINIRGAGVITNHDDTSLMRDLDAIGFKHHGFSAFDERFESLYGDDGEDYPFGHDPDNEW
jgi:hypothetical protein